MIKGDKIYLTELDRANAETIRTWLNDPEVHRFLMVGHVPITREEEERYYDSQGTAPGVYNFEIHVAADGRYIGNVGLKDVSLPHRNGEIGIAIGSKEDLGQGIRRRCHHHLPAGSRSSPWGCTPCASAPRKARAGLELYRRIGFVQTGRRAREGLS